MLLCLLITFLTCTVSGVFCSRYDRLAGRLDVIERKQFHDSVSFRTDIKLLFEKLSNISNDEISPDCVASADTELTNEYVTKIDDAVKMMKRSIQAEKQHSREFFDHIKARVKRHEELCSTNIESIRKVLEDGLDKIETKHFQMNSRFDDIDSVLQVLESQQEQTKAVSENLLAKMELLQEILDPISKQALCGTWKHFNVSCYFLGKEAVTFDDANTICQNMNAYLVEIESAEENNFLTGLAENEKIGVHEYGIWVGGTDRESEGMWTWGKSKRKFYFTSWKSGEPNGGTRENCLHLYKSYAWLWNDARCTRQMSYICKRKTLYLA